MKYIKYSFCIIFILIIFIFFIMTINNNKSISELEKRSLQTFPKLSIENVLDNSYMEKLSKAFSDQLEFRNSLIKGYYLFQFQKYSGDVVKGNNDSLYASYQRYNIENGKSEAEEIANLINEEANKLPVKFIFVSIPRKDAVFKEDLPKSYISSDTLYLEQMKVMKENLNNNVYLIDGYEVFNNDNSNNTYYYKQDHHITPYGAYLLYKEIISLTDNKTSLYDLSNYEIGKTYVNGSFNNQLGQSVKPNYESLYLIPKYELDYVRYENDKLSNLKVFGIGNTYEKCYMEGDNAYTVIDTNRKDLPNILFVGSSFTNIIEALSIPSFNKTVSIDYRHNNSGNNIAYYVDKHNIDYVVFIPSQSNNALSKSMVKTHLGL